MQSKSRGAYTLLEMVLVLSGMGLLLLLLASGLTGAIRSQRLLMDLSRDIASRSTIADQFRGDVATAIGAGDPENENVGRDDQLLLRKPDGGTVLLFWQGNAESGYSLVREETPLGGKKTTRILLNPRDGLRGSFHLSERSTLARLELVEVQPRGKTTSGFVIFAAVGGDRR